MQSRNPALQYFTYQVNNGKYFVSLKKKSAFLPFWAQLFEGWLAVIHSRGFSFNPGFFIFCLKAFSQIIFPILFRASNHQIADQRN